MCNHKGEWHGNRLICIRCNALLDVRKYKISVKRGIRVYEFASAMGVDSKYVRSMLVHIGAVNRGPNGSVRDFWGASSNIPYKTAMKLLNYPGGGAICFDCGPTGEEEEE